MTLYLTAAPNRLAQARAATAQLAHAAYRIGLGSQLLAAPLPAALRGGLMVVSDRQAPAVEQPEPLARQLVRVCLRRGFSGVVLDLEELPEGRWAEDRAALIRQLAPLLGAYGRRLYVPEIYAAASPETVVLLCTALSGGSLQGRLEETCAAYGAQRLALDLERLMMDFPLPCPSGEGIRLSREELAIRMQGRSVFYAEDLCARYFTYRRGGQTHFVLFDDAGTLRRKIEMGQALSFAHAAVLRDDGAGLGADEPLLLQTGHILPHGVFAQPHRPTDGVVAGMAPIGSAILAAQEVVVDGDLVRSEVEIEDFVGDEIVVLIRVTLGPALVHQTSPPTRVSTHRRNFSLGTTMRFPIRSAGKPVSCMSS